MTPRATVLRAAAGVAVALGALLGATSAALGQPQASTLDLLQSTAIPARDPLAVWSRLHGVDPATISRVMQDRTPDYRVGRTDTFWVGNQATGEYHQTQAVLKYASPHAYWYVEQGRDVSDDAIRRSADFFEAHTYPTDRAYYGSEWFPGVDNDPHITVLMARVPGVGAYFSSWDEYPLRVYPHSNEREMVHMNLDAYQPGNAGFDGVLAHEFQHMIHWNSNPNDETWTDEGSAELATDLVLGQPGSTSSYQSQPDTQLTAWSDQPGEVGVHYEAAYLFLRYFVDRFGGPDILYDLISQPSRGDGLFDRYLAEHGSPERFADLFTDFAVANLVHDPQVEDGRYSQPNVRLNMRVGARLKVGDAPLEAQVHQFGADYVDLVGDGGDATLTFRGSPSVRLAGADPTSGKFLWWSNRADGMDATLTREFDLTGAQHATLDFKTWYEIEDDYDFLYVMASADGGVTWKPLAGSGMSTANPTGNGLGPGFTGVSGGGAEPQWVDSRVDLSQFAGQRVLVRFEYVTDQAFNRSGALLDDIRIPELGFLDDAEGDAGWQAVGFIRSDNTIPQTYGLRLVRTDADGTHVQDVPVDADGRASVRIGGLGGATRSARLVVTATAPRTLEVARYTLQLAAP